MAAPLTLDVVIFLFVSSRERYRLIPDLMSDQTCSPFPETYDEVVRSYWYWSLCVFSQKEPKLWKIVKGLTRFLEFTMRTSLPHTLVWKPLPGVGGITCF